MRWVVVGVAALLGCGKSAGPKEIAGSGVSDNVATAATACASDDECVIDCTAKQDCCDFPWCESAQHVKDVKAAADFNRSYCPTAKKDCRDYGDRIDPDYTVAAKCVNKACTAVKTPKAAAVPAPVSKIVDVSTLEHSCKSASDCVVVQDKPCAVCQCAGEAIAKSALPKFEELAKAIRCEPREVQCSDCRRNVATCDKGVCGTKPEGK